MVSVTRFALAALALGTPASARRHRHDHGHGHGWYTSIASNSAPGSATFLPTSSPLTETSKAIVTIITSIITPSYGSDIGLVTTTTEAEATSSVIKTTSTTTKATSTEASASATSASSGIESDFKPGVKWDICIDHPIKHDSVDDFVPVAAKVWDIDLGHAHEFPDMIPMMKKAGKFVICYFNAGAVQSWDEDKAQFPDDIVGKALDYPYGVDEFYVDIRDERVLDIMKARLDSAVDVGCDGVDPDNVDAWVQDGDDPTGFSLKTSDYATYLKNMAEYAHSLTTQEGKSLLVGQKNAPEIAADLVSTLDFAVLEQCRGSSDESDETYSFCSDFQAYIDADKPVLQIEYPPSVSLSDGTLSTSDKSFYCNAEPGDKNFSKVLKWASAQLDGWGEYCIGKSYRTPEAEYE
ncbi:glycoside hydrolase superfamily [Ilyonectria destructans]|nr:glycoside hydrolase superfamily [Ilyonectria destructans]